MNWNRENAAELQDGGQYSEYKLTVQLKELDKAGN